MLDFVRGEGSKTGENWIWCRTRELSDSQPPPDLQNAALTAWVQQLKLRLWARTWVAARLAPRQWGERLDVSVTETRISITAALKAAESRLINLQPEPLARDEGLQTLSTGKQENYHDQII